MFLAARGGAKFRPKAKCKAKDGISGSIPSKLPDAVHAVQPTDVVHESRSSLVVKPSRVAIPDSLPAEVAVSNGCDDSYSRVGRSVGEVKEKIFAISLLHSIGVFSTMFFFFF